MIGFRWRLIEIRNRGAWETSRAPSLRGGQADQRVFLAEIIATNSRLASSIACEACDTAGIAVTLPKPMTSGLEARGRFGKQDFVYLSDEDAYRCPAGEKLTCRYANEEAGQQLRRYCTNACRDCALKASCTTGKERRITRWEHEHVLEEVQRRLDNTPLAMRQRRETVEHPFGTIKARMGAGL